MSENQEMIARLEEEKTQLLTRRAERDQAFGYEYNVLCQRHHEAALCGEQAQANAYWEHANALSARLTQDMCDIHARLWEIHEKIEWLKKQ